MQQWADGLLGHLMKPKQGDSAKAVSYKLGEKGTGVWFTLENGGQAYRRLPDIH